MSIFNAGNFIGAGHVIDAGHLREGRMRRLLWFAVVVAVVGAGCGNFIFGADPPDDPESVFESFWQSYDRYYAHFDVKNVDWDQVYDDHRPRVGPDTTDEELFEVLSDMIIELEDGHVYLVSDERRALSNSGIRSSRRDFDADVVQNHYVDDVQKPTSGNELWYGTIGGDVGYLRISTLSGGSGTGSNVSGWIEEVDTAVEALADTEAMIVDVRNNSGGRAFNSKYVAGHFAPDRRRFLMTRSRNGPAHEDFSEPHYWYVEPHDKPAYDRPVVVLTNRNTFSAAEWLTLALRQYDHVIHMGKQTGGGLAMFLPRQLPNGWMHTVSVQDTRGPQGRSFERIGVPPQQHLENGAEEIDRGQDAMLDEAVEFLMQ